MKDQVRRRTARARAAAAHVELAEERAHRLVTDPRFGPRLDWLRARRQARADFQRCKAAGDLMGALEAGARWLELGLNEAPKPEPGR